jgi:hypothetical protein
LVAVLLSIFQVERTSKPVTHMGRAFTAAPLLLLLGLLALGLGAATANVSGGGRQEPIEKPLLFSILGCLCGGFVLSLADFR